MYPCREDLRRALAIHARVDLPALPGRRNHLLTGVLVPLWWRPEPVCIVTLRAEGLSKHAGEICFPGGRPDDDDADLRHTALREAHEELGIDHADVLGELSSIPLYTSDYRLQPFVAAIDSGSFRVQAAEVAAVIEIELRAVLEQERILAIPWSHGGQTYLSPVFELGDVLMYGATAHTFLELLTVVAPLYGLPLPPLVEGPYDWPSVLSGRARG